MSETTSGFTAGARVWVDEGYSIGREDRVAKVHKTGRFTLESDPSAQYSPYEIQKGFWRAQPTSKENRWSRRTIWLWSPERNAELDAIKARAERKRRWQSIQQRIEAFYWPQADEALITAVEAALAAHSAKPEDHP